MFDKALWKPKIKDWPTWPCPSCGSVALGRRQGDQGFLLEETGPSERAHEHDAWDPDWIDKRFAGLLRCHNPLCGEVVAVSGYAKIEERYGYDENGDEARWVEDIFYPVYFHEPPPIFAIHEDCPDEVRVNLTSAFALIWCDLGGAANRLRAGVEALLDEQGVTKTRLDGGRRRPRTAHDRIQRFSSKNAEAASYLMAIKWLGNIGSHGGAEDVSRDDILDAMELFEAAIDLVYLKSAKKLKKVAADLSKRKGKPSKRKKKRK